MKQFLKTIVILAVIVAVAYIGLKVVKSYTSKDKAKVVFRTEEIARTDVIRSISATGTVEPEELVNVGAQVNGKVMSFGKDSDGNPVDFSSRVTTGMVLAQIDDVPYIQVYAPTSNAEEAEIEWFYEDIQDLLELTPK